MKTWRVELSGLARVSQTQYIVAESQQEAEDAAICRHWTETWEYEYIENDNTIEVVASQPCFEKESN